MKVAGIIAEYNPFHNGHKYHLEKTRQICGAEIVVCVMSGNFLQRGEPAIFDKWIRAEVAVKNGVDVVLELPFLYACNHAEYFARGAVGILNGLGAVTHLSFGSESGNLDEIMKCADIFMKEGDLFSKNMKAVSSAGGHSARNKWEVLKRMGEEVAAKVISEPNNILGVEYMKQLKMRNSAMTPITILRKGAQYHDMQLGGSIASASAIRNALIHDGAFSEILHTVPFATQEILKKMVLKKNDLGRIVTSEDFYQMIAYQIFSSEEKKLSRIFSITEGLENRIKKKNYEAQSLEDLICFIKSKRYTRTRIQRIMMHILMELNRGTVEMTLEKDILYGRLLGASVKGSKWLKSLNNNSIPTIPLITNVNKEREFCEKIGIYEMIKMDCKASDIYHLALQKEDIWQRSDYKMYPYVEKK